MSASKPETTTNNSDQVDILGAVDDLTAGPFVSDGAEIAIFDKYRDKLEIKTPSWKQMVGNLSGGNQQKIVIGKWLAMHPTVLIAASTSPKNPRGHSSHRKKGSSGGRP